MSNPTNTDEATEHMKSEEAKHHLIALCFIPARSRSGAFPRLYPLRGDGTTRTARRASTIRSMRVHDGHTRARARGAAGMRGLLCVRVSLSLKRWHSTMENDCRGFELWIRRAQSLMALSKFATAPIARKLINSPVMRSSAQDNAGENIPQSVLRIPKPLR